MERDLLGKIIRKTAPVLLLTACTPQTEAVVNYVALGTGMVMAVVAVANTYLAKFRNGGEKQGVEIRRNIEDLQTGIKK